MPDKRRKRRRKMKKVIEATINKYKEELKDGGFLTFSIRTIYGTGVFVYADAEIQTDMEAYMKENLQMAAFPANTDCIWDEDEEKDMEVILFPSKSRKNLFFIVPEQKIKERLQFVVEITGTPEMISVCKSEPGNRTGFDGLAEVIETMEKSKGENLDFELFHTH